jgi:hypothetical protein
MEKQKTPMGVVTVEVKDVKQDLLRHKLQLVWRAETVRQETLITVQ